MASFRFTDRHGVSWMVLPSLPDDYPDTGESGTPALLRGFTFRSDRGELRVLPRAAMPRRASIPPLFPAIGTRSRITPVDTPDWEAMLSASIAWPPL